MSTRFIAVDENVLDFSKDGVFSYFTAWDGAGRWDSLVT